jgi:hypothetical protein
MARRMTSETEKRLIELVTNTVGFECLMYVPASFPRRSSLLYKREHARMSVRNPLDDDGDLFRLAVAAPAVIPQKISRSSQDTIEIRCAIVREGLVKAVPTMVSDPCANDGIDSSMADTVVGVGQQ